MENLVACFSAQVTEFCAALVHDHGHTLIHAHPHKACHVYIAHAPPNNKNKNVNMRAALTVLARKGYRAHCTVLIQYSILLHMLEFNQRILKDKNKTITNLAILKEHIDSKKSLGNGQQLKN